LAVTNPLAYPVEAGEF